MVRGCGRFHPWSYTMAMAHRSAIPVESTSKPGGGSGKDWSIGERAWRRYARHSIDGFDDGYVFQHRQKSALDQPGIGQSPVLRRMGDLQSSRHVFQTVARPCGIESACHVQRVKYIAPSHW
jgi:hypothetical protein